MSSHTYFISSKQKKKISLLNGGNHQKQRYSFPALRSLKRIFAGFVLAGGLLFFTDTPQAELADMIVAKVNEKIILLSDIRIRMAQTIGIEKLKTLDGKTKAEIEKKILDKMVEEKILATYAVTLGLNVDDATVEQNIEAIKKSNNMADWQLEEALKNEGITMEEYHNILKEQRLISLVINREVTSQVFIEDEELKSYYDDNSDAFTTDEEVHVKHIFLKRPPGDLEGEEEKVRAKIADILGRLKKGEDFNQLARLYSEDATASAGGDLGFFKRGKMVPAFESAAFSLEVGSISDIVTTDFGFHVIKCVEKKNKKVLTFEEAKDFAKNRLYSEKSQEKKGKLIEKLKKDVTVELKI